MRPRKWLRRVAIAGGSLALAVALSAVAFLTLDRAFPPPLPERISLSKEVIDRDGALLRAFAAPDGRWRLAVGLDQVDPRFVDMLIAYEDKRFHEHHGVDPLALMRAAGVPRAISTILPLTSTRTSSGWPITSSRRSTPRLS